jgi:hypothetical protein
MSLFLFPLRNQQSLGSKFVRLLTNPAMAHTPQASQKPDKTTGLLSGAAPPDCRSEIIDFSRTQLPEYSGLFALLIHNLLTPTECNELLNAAQSTSKWEQALINVGGGRQILATEARNCDRIILDDEVLAKRLLDRIFPHLPPEVVTLENKARITGNGPLRRKDVLRITRLNERLRFLKYTRGMYFREHCDGSYVTPDGKEISFITVHLYLNGEVSNTEDDAVKCAQREGRPVDQRPLQGGSTRFHSMNLQRYLDVFPQTGSCLVFQHRGLLHSGDDVVQGTKYTMRTDVMYQKIEAE